jgi:serine/threonine protein kinase
MAPELYEEESYSTKVDVFSFGLILYEVVVGMRVFSAWLTPTRKWSGIPERVKGHIKEVIEKCWADDPEARLTFQEILEDLKAIKFRTDVATGEAINFLETVRLEERWAVDGFTDWFKTSYGQRRQGKHSNIRGAIRSFNRASLGRDIRKV